MRYHPELPKRLLYSLSFESLQQTVRVVGKEFWQLTQNKDLSEQLSQALGSAMHARFAHGGRIRINIPTYIASLELKKSVHRYLHDRDISPNRNVAERILRSAGVRPKVWMVQSI